MQYSYWKGYYSVKMVFYYKIKQRVHNTTLLGNNIRYF